ncbi:MAG TPA: hypothetical protein VD978_28715 [Azospirillum sp.]|nr:hypothetical protein [Azospirillum sp.]
MRRWMILAAVAALLASGEAGATLVNKGDGKAVGPATGGVDVGSSNGRVRIQCWQDGRKILDDSDLAIVSLSIANQINGLRLRRTIGSDLGLTVAAQARTSCLLGPHD